jgi:hypothetical protein
LTGRFSMKSPIRMIAIPPNFMSTPVSWRRRASIVASRAHRAAFDDNGPDARKFQTQTELVLSELRSKIWQIGISFAVGTVLHQRVNCPSVLLQPAQLTLTTCPIPYSSLREARAEQLLFSAPNPPHNGCEGFCNGRSPFVPRP